MAYDLVIRPDAEADLAEAFLWYENKASGLGSKFLDSIDASLSDIEENPNLFPKLYRQVRRALIRRFPFAIFYLKDANRIVVLAILHAHRDPNIWPQDQ